MKLTGSLKKNGSNIMNRILKLISPLLMPLMNKLTPACEVISHTISKSLDTKISLRERLQIRLHIMVCAICRRYREQLLSINTLFTNYAANKSPHQESLLSEETRERMKQVLSKQKGN